MLVKNGRFKAGTEVDIYYNPRYTGYSTAVSDPTLSAGKINITITHSDSNIATSVKVGNVIALGFAAGNVKSVTSTKIVVEFPESTFHTLNASSVRAYLGSQVQVFIVFDDSKYIMKGMKVRALKEKYDVSTYSNAEITYNLNYIGILLLSETKQHDTGELSSVLASNSFVLKSCDDANYSVNHSEWNGTFPITLTGASADPIMRMASLAKREMITNKSRTKVSFEFKLMG